MALTRRWLLSFMVKLVGLGLLLSLTAAFPAASTNSPFSARVVVDTTDYWIGDWIDIEVRIDHPAGASITHSTGDTLGPFSVLEREPVRRLSEEESVTYFKIAYYDSGHVTVPPFRFGCRVPGDTTRYTVTTPPLDLIVRAVPVDTTADIEDIKPPVSMAYTWREIAVPTVLSLLAAAVIWLFLRYFKERRGEGERSTKGIERRPPHVVAIERLKDIEEKKLWQRGHLKPYYTEVTDVIREYLEGRYGIRALEMTTDEILSRLPAIELPDDLRDDLASTLNRADLVKFAKYQALPQENTETMQKAFSLVEKTIEEDEAQEEEEVTRVTA